MKMVGFEETLLEEYYIKYQRQLAVTIIVMNLFSTKTYIFQNHIREDFELNQ
jgi:hypothetical protein